MLLFINCNQFKKDKEMSYYSDLHKIVDIINEHSNDALWFDSDDIPEMIDLDLDVVSRNISNKNISYSGLVEENDSLILFIKYSNSIDKIEKRIIYDFAKKPRNFAIENISEESYEVVQINERWYVSNRKPN